ncbi:MAG: aminopeptidase P family protein [Betaproteobacteria bacterium]|nr:aminopeptidase P family protein [Betaproteobacteria bacterium]
MRTEIVDRWVAATKRHGFDAMLSCSPENFAYLTGFIVPSQPLMRHRHAMGIVTADGRTAILGVDMEATTIGRREPDTATKIWAEFSDNAMAVLADLLRELGLADSRIGIELDYLPASDFDKLRAALPGATFVAGQHIIAHMRQVKTPEEIALLRRLSRISDRSITDALRAVKAGDSEMDLAGHLTRNVFSLGAEQFKLMIIATGERSQLPNVGPSERKLTTGDVCRVEIFPVISGYHAGVCRTAVVQKAPAHAERIWKHLVDCKYQLLDQVKPGASCRAIYAAFIAKLAELGLPPIPFVGHGIGLFLHEDPYLGKTPEIGRDGDAMLEAGMVLGVEPLCYQTGHGYGMQLKDMLLVTERGSEMLSDYCSNDELIVVR